ncbi:OCIA domain-containing protein 1 [Pogonomyrmex barbatus]|uniref:OCIA domain-containing protein 1 n=1 Tax=Pogonomyrmex barbatus TaxID=144034 RepID=A0A6I9WB29_9HYME|nr:OCIA domain-containing protein 1 [Pogonomyrmex barbatus]
MTTTVTDVQQPNYAQTQRQPTRQQVTLTPEETMVMQACMKRSSVLVPTLLGAAAGYGVIRLSPFRGNTTITAICTMGTGVVSMLLARLAIAEMCLRKVASMPNSNLIERLREAGYDSFASRMQPEGFRPLVVQSEIQSSEESTASQESTGIVFNDYPSMNTYDTYSSLNYDSDLSVSKDTDLSEPMNLQKGVNYDELRRQNRDEFYKKNKQWYTPRTREPPSESYEPKEATEQIPGNTKSSPMQEKTKYGDVWG